MSETRDNDQAKRLRREMVQTLRDKGRLSDPRIEGAFETVPRHLFLPDLPLEQVYVDRAVATKRSDEQIILSSSSQPSMMILMLEQLKLQRGDNVLEIGAGTGYNAAILKAIVGKKGRVTTVEFDEDIVERARDNIVRAAVPGVEVVHADGSFGYAPNAPYDAIICTAAIWDVPRAWVSQLKPGKAIITPVWMDALQVSAKFVARFDGTLFSDSNLPCSFVSLRGKRGVPDMTQRVASSGLVLLSGDVDTLDIASLHALLSYDAQIEHLGLPLSAADYFFGFMQYMMLNEPANEVFVLYSVDSTQMAYGIEGNGFALIGRGSAVFVPYDESGVVHVFGSVDSFIDLQNHVAAWNEIGRPGSHNLRLLLSPKSATKRMETPGKAYPRYDHTLHVWQEE